MGDFSTDFFFKAMRVHARKGPTLPCASQSGEIALAGSRRMGSTLVAAPVLFAHAVVIESKIYIIITLIDAHYHA